MLAAPLLDRHPIRTWRVGDRVSGGFVVASREDSSAEVCVIVKHAAIRDADQASRRFESDVIPRANHVVDAQIN